MLTEKQKDLLLFIHERIGQDGVSPSFDEMKVALDLKSKSGIHRLITALEERGFIRRLANRARALEVLKLPEHLNPDSLRPKKTEPDNVHHLTGQERKGASTTASGAVAQAFEQTVDIAVMGRIAAGVPISAIQDHSKDIAVSSAMLGPGHHYALDVHGDSMIEAGILDGDTVLIQKSSTAINGDIVVAFIINEDEATLKRFHKKGNIIELKAANPAYENKTYSSDEIEVQGKLIGLLRNY